MVLAQAIRRVSGNPARLSIGVLGNAIVDVSSEGVRRLPKWEEDIRFEGPVVMNAGGSGLNSSLVLSSLGADVTLHAAIGDDTLGTTVRQRAEKGRVKFEARVLHKESTGCCIVLNGPEERAVMAWHGASAKLKPEWIDMDVVVSSHRHLHVGGYFSLGQLKPGLAKMLGRAKECGLSTSVGLNYDHKHQWLKDGYLPEILQHTDILFANEIEAHALAGDSCFDTGEGSGEAAKQIGSFMPSWGTAVFTRGEKGAVAWYGIRRYRNSAFAVAEKRERNTNHAIFRAGFIACRVDGHIEHMTFSSVVVHLLPPPPPHSLPLTLCRKNGKGILHEGFYPGDKIRDPTGAGDALLGAFLFVWLQGHGTRNTAEALAWGCAAGAMTAMVKGASMYPPTREDIETVLRTDVAKQPTAAIKRAAEIREAQSRTHPRDMKDADSSFEIREDTREAKSATG